VKFIRESSKEVTDFLPYHKVAEDGIVLGLRRYHFFRKYSLSRNTQQYWQTEECHSVEMISAFRGKTLWC
jgi:hypothetical protein